MKGMDMLCSSQASTAICLSLDQSSSCISPSTIQLGSRAIDRHNPIITDPSRHSHHSQNTLKNSSKPPHHHDPRDLKKKTNNYSSSNPINTVLRRTWVRPSPTTSASSRYLLSEAAFLDNNNNSDNNVSSDCDSVLASSSTPNDATKPEFSLQNQTLTKPASSDQVVVLRVSLHCRGCEGKLRKHLSRMEGVTSFNIDFAAKKVTIVGDVTPMSVLASVSKVKNAQFWPPSSAALGSGVAETKK